MFVWMMVGAAVLVFAPKAADLVRERNYEGLAIMGLVLLGIPLIGWLTAY